MKKLKIFLSILLAFMVAGGALLCSGCGSESDEDIATNAFVRLINYLQNDDAAGAKTVFAPNIVATLPDFDEQLNKLVDYYEGEMEMFITHGGSGGESNHYGSRTRDISMTAMVTTTVEVYFCSFVMYTVYTADSNYLGMWEFNIISYTDNARPDYSYWSPSDENGITIAEPVEDIDRDFPQLAKALVGDDIQAIYWRFANPLQKIDGFNDKLTALLEMCEGEFLSYTKTNIKTEVIYDENGFIDERYIWVSLTLLTTEENYAIALKYCSIDWIYSYTDDPTDYRGTSNEGIWSMSITRLTLSTPDPYLGDGSWSNGLYIE